MINITIEIDSENVRVYDDLMFMITSHTSQEPSTRVSGKFTQKPQTINPVIEYGQRLNSLRNIIVDTRAEAEAVLDVLNNLLSEYGTVSVSDFLAAVGRDTEFSDLKWGWKSVNAAQIRKCGYPKPGFRIWLPTPELLNK